MHDEVMLVINVLMIVQRREYHTFEVAYVFNRRSSFALRVKLLRGRFTVCGQQVFKYHFDVLSRARAFSGIIAYDEWKYEVVTSWILEDGGGGRCSVYYKSHYCALYHV